MNGPLLGERALEARVEEVARECNATWRDIAMRWALGGLHARVVVWSIEFGVREDVGGSGTSIPSHAGSVHLAQLDARVEAGVTTILRSSGLL
jgi:hypothetical protein